MELSWDRDGWEDYLYWQKNDKKILRKINVLIEDILRSPFEGTGKPELLKNNLTGYHARRITDEHRLIYKVFNDKILIIQCRFHY
jgi:toxin YoeB